MPRKILMMLVAIVIAPHAFAAGSFSIPQEQLSDLRAQRSLLDAQVKKLDSITKQIDDAKSDRDAAKASIKRQEALSNEARTKLEKLQDFDRDNPGDITPEQLRAAENRNKQAYQDLKDSKEKSNNAETKINSLNVEAENQYAEFLRLQKSFERDVGRVVDAKTQERLGALQVKKQVSVTEKVACGDDSIPVCKERSKKAAELKASEQGSIVFVNSLTEVKNFKLSKEELRSEVQATLSDKVFSNQHMVGEAEYETTITASVEPVIGDTLRQQMAAGIRSQVYDMIGGRIDFSQVQNPALAAADDESPEPVKPVKAKKKKVVQEEPEDQPEPPVVEPRPRARPPAPAPTPRSVEKPTFTF